MAFIRDPDRYTRGVGAIAARDAGDRHRAARRLQRARSLNARDRQLAQFTYGPVGGIGAIDVRGDGGGSSRGRTPPKTSTAKPRGSFQQPRNIPKSAGGPKTRPGTGGGTGVGGNVGTQPPTTGQAPLPGNTGIVPPDIIVGGGATSTSSPSPTSSGGGGGGGGELEAGQASGTTPSIDTSPLEPVVIPVIEIDPVPVQASKPSTDGLKKLAVFGAIAFGLYLLGNREGG